MNAGLPTTGIGGIFYFFSVVLMVIIELIQIIRGKSTRHKISFVFKQLLLTLGILLAIFGTGYILKMLIPVKEIKAITGIDTNSSVAHAVQNNNLIFLTPFIILISLFLFTQLLRIIFRIQKYCFRD